MGFPDKATTSPGYLLNYSSKQQQSAGYWTFHIPRIIFCKSRLLFEHHDKYVNWHFQSLPSDFQSTLFLKSDGALHLNMYYCRSNDTRKLDTKQVIITSASQALTL